MYNFPCYDVDDIQDKIIFFLDLAISFNLPLKYSFAIPPFYHPRTKYEQVKLCMLFIIWINIRLEGIYKLYSP